MAKTKKTQKMPKARRRAIMLAPTAAEYRLLQRAAAHDERPVATFTLRAALQVARVSITAAETAAVQLAELMNGTVARQAAHAAVGEETT